MIPVGSGAELGGDISKKTKQHPNSWGIEQLLTPCLLANFKPEIACATGYFGQQGA